MSKSEKNICSKNSLYFQLLKLLVTAVMISGLLFFMVNNVTNYMLDTYYMDADYTKRQDKKYVQEFQNYIDKERLNSDDAQKIAQWVKKQNILSLSIYKNNMLIFDSQNLSLEMPVEYIGTKGYDWCYPVEFADGETQVDIYGMYGYRLYTVTFIVELIISFFMFLLLVLLGIREKINYILRIGREIKLLESGNLDYEITIKGSDELAELARGLDCMRISFREQVVREAQIVNENQRIITEMSHDLRTPITSIMLYTEIIKKKCHKKYEENDSIKIDNVKNDIGENQLIEYLDKIEDKAQRMKQLTDHLFEYSLTADQTDLPMEEPESIQILFYDLLSETYSYLDQKGFKTEFFVEWENVKICVCTGFVTRIMDNITSNILKYAEPNMPIVIKSVYKKELAGFSFENSVKAFSKEQQSTEIGLRGIKNMMSKMNGSCIIQQKRGCFKITILFPMYS